MVKLPIKRLDIVNALVAFGVLLFALIVYLRTMAPTLSFWDCGEFIAACHVLGIPHPPGSPLYVMMGRIFSVVPFFADLCARVNLLSALSSAFAAMFGYLAVVRILRTWFPGDSSTYSRLIVYAGGACSSLFMAFGLTNWTNAVEAEVYGLTTLITSICLWLTLIYYEKQGTSWANRIMLLVIYLSVLGIGVHLSAFLILPVAALFFILKKDTPARYWFYMAAFFLSELYLIFALSSLPGEIGYYIPVTIVAIFFAFYIFSFDRVPRLLLIALGGFVLAIAPLFDMIPRAAQSAGGGAVAANSSLTGPLNVVGVLALVGLAGLAGYMLYRHYQARAKKQPADIHALVTSVLIVAALVMVAILKLGIRGYTAFLVLSALSLVVLAALCWRQIRWPYMIAIAALALVIVGVRPFLFGMLVAVLAIVILGRVYRLQGWKTAIMAIVLSVAAYSIHGFVPIRSAQQPSINENNPSASTDRLINFLERKQYLGVSMVERMFDRRSEWENQFGNFHRMGFWGFFSEQFGLTGPKFLIFFIIGLFGVWEAVRRKPPAGLLLLILLFISAIGLILYMNFADGVRQNEIVGNPHIEVRDRDYFFTPAFVLFGLAIGIGITALVQFIRDAVGKFSPVPKKVVLGSLMVWFLLPGYPLARNYYQCDRSRNYVPYDYAHNILLSCRPNSILFTGGDNDTFPIWCLQEVYGFRKDVSTVCLPLANTAWYIKQVRNGMGLEMGWTDDEIDSLVPYRLRDGRSFRLQDQVIDALIFHNRDSIPVHFNTTVGASTRRYLGQRIDTLLEQTGMVWEVKATGPGPTFDLERSLELYTSPGNFQYRGFDDTTIYKDEATRRAMRNTANSALMVIDSLNRGGQKEQAEMLAIFVTDRVPEAVDVVHYLSSMYVDQGNVAALENMISTTRYGDIDRMKVYLARVLREKGETTRAELLLQAVLEDNSKQRAAFEELARLYYAQQQYSSMERLFNQWLRANPDDDQVRLMLEELQKMKVPVDRQDGGGQ